MKKIVAVLCCLMMMVCCFGAFGCSSRDALRIINFRPEDQAFYDFLIEEFKKEHPDLKVIYECVSTDGYPNLQSSRLTANQVDVFGTEAANVRSVELRKYMMPLNDLEYSDGTSLWDKMNEGDVSQVVYEGDKYVAPLGSVEIVVYYNKDIMEQACDPSDFANGEYPTTWDEFYSLLIKFQTLKNQKKIDDVIYFGGLEAWPISMIMSAGEIPTVYAVDDKFYLKLAKSEKGYDFSHPLYEDYFTKIKTLCGFIDPLSTGQTYNLAPSTFAMGNSALMIDGTWSYPQVMGANPQFEPGFFPLPLNDDAEYNKYVPTKSGSGFAINKNTNKPELAKEFIEFHYRPDIYRKYINTVLTSPVIKGVEIEDPYGYAGEMYQFEGLLTMENRWMDGIAGVEMFRDIGLKYITSDLSVADSIKQMNDILQSTASNWQRKSVIGMWFDYFFPGEGRDVWAPED